jgi:hypothetical protein
MKKNMSLKLSGFGRIMNKPTAAGDRLKPVSRVACHPESRRVAYMDVGGRVAPGSLHGSRLVE